MSGGGRNTGLKTMSDRNPIGRDEIDAAVAAKLRALQLARPLPVPAEGDPSDEELLRYIDGSLGDAERERLEARIAESPFATARVTVVVEALRDCGYPAPRVDAVGRRAVRYVFQLAGDALTFLRGSDLPEALTPALAVRGAATVQDSSFYEFCHRFGEVEARLQLERVGVGFELGLHLTDGGVPVEGARVNLRRSGKTIDSAVTEGGACTFRGLPAARYQLDVRRGTDEVGSLHVDVLAV